MSTSEQQHTNADLPSRHGVTIHAECHGAAAAAPATTATAAPPAASAAATPATTTVSFFSTTTTAKAAAGAAAADNDAYSVCASPAVCPCSNATSESDTPTAPASSINGSFSECAGTVSSQIRCHVVPPIAGKPDHRTLCPP